MFVVKLFKNHINITTTSKLLSRYIVKMYMRIEVPICAILADTISEVAFPIFPSMIWCLIHACCTNGSE